MPTLAEQLALSRDPGLLGRRQLMAVRRGLPSTLTRTARLLPFDRARAALTPTAAVPARALPIESGFVSRYKAPAKFVPGAPHPVTKPSVVAGVSFATRPTPLNRVNVSRVAETGFIPGGDKRGPLTQPARKIHIISPGKDLLGSTRENPQSQRPRKAVPTGMLQLGLPRRAAEGGGKKRRVLAVPTGMLQLGLPRRAAEGGGKERRVLPRPFEGGPPARFGGPGRERGELPRGLAKREDDEFPRGLARRDEADLPPAAAGRVAGAAGGEKSTAPSGVPAKLAAFVKDQPVIAAGAGIGIYFGVKYLIAALA